MTRRVRHTQRSRLLLTLAALLSLIFGYYLGQYWQRRPLTELSAVVYPAGRPVPYPETLNIPAENDEDGNWRLFTTANTALAPCRELLRHYAFVLNRLADRPKIQARLRLTVLAYDRPDATAAKAFTGGAEWVDVVGGTPQQLDALSAQLGILPAGGPWCSGVQANAVLVSPQHEAWALIPLEQAAMMARNIRTVIDFVE